MLPEYKTGTLYIRLDFHAVCGGLCLASVRSQETRVVCSTFSTLDGRANVMDKEQISQYVMVTVVCQ